MTSNRLKLNSDNFDKTEFIWLGTRQQLAKVSSSSLLIKGQFITLLNKVRDLSVIIDSELSIDAHNRTLAIAVFISYSSCAVYGNHFPPMLAVLLLSRLSPVV